LWRFFAREEFASEIVTRLGHGGFLMLEYQKSSAAAPKQRHCFGFEYLQRRHMRWLALAVGEQLLRDGCNSGAPPSQIKLL
jgi:hypothetical protein